MSKAIVIDDDAWISAAHTSDKKIYTYYDENEKQLVAGVDIESTVDRYVEAAEAPPPEANYFDEDEKQLVAGVNIDSRVDRYVEEATSPAAAPPPQPYPNSGKRKPWRRNHDAIEEDDGEWEGDHDDEEESFRIKFPDLESEGGSSEEFASDYGGSARFDEEQGVLDDEGSMEDDEFTNRSWTERTVPDDEAVYASTMTPDLDDEWTEQEISEEDTYFTVYFDVDENGDPAPSTRWEDDWTEQEVEDMTKDDREVFVTRQHEMGPEERNMIFRLMGLAMACWCMFGVSIALICGLILVG